MEALTGLPELFDRLSREPDFDAPELRAFDAADELILMTAAEAARLSPRQVVVVGDRHGALTLGAIDVLGAERVRVHQDPLLSELALRQNAERLLPASRSKYSYTSLPLGRELLEGARVVMLQLPRGNDALEEIAWSIARWADPSVQVYAGGRDKHMSREMNEILARYFSAVSAGRGWRKARVLEASRPRASKDSPFPRWGSDPDLNFRLAAFGATFGGAKLDHGSRMLVRGLARAVSPETAAPSQIVDLGCGNGVLAVSAALAFPRARVIATDQSAAAVAATRLTASAAGVADRVETHRADALDAVGDGWADLILLNPPFHSGNAVHDGVGRRLISLASRALVPGGELRLVHNSHLRYRSLVEREIGAVRQLERDRRYTVLSARSNRAARVDGG